MLLWIVFACCIQSKFKNLQSIRIVKVHVIFIHIFNIIIIIYFLILFSRTSNDIRTFKKSLNQIKKNWQLRYMPYYESIHLLIKAWFGIWLFSASKKHAIFKAIIYSYKLRHFAKKLKAAYTRTTVYAFGISTNVVWCP